MQLHFLNERRVASNGNKENVGTPNLNAARPTHSTRERECWERKKERKKERKRKREREKERKREREKEIKR